MAQIAGALENTPKIGSHNPVPRRPGAATAPVCTVCRIDTSLPTERRVAKDNGSSESEQSDDAHVRWAQAKDR